MRDWQWLSLVGSGRAVARSVAGGGRRRVRAQAMPILCRTPYSAAMSRVTKPKPSKHTNTSSRSSDRRLAAGRQPAQFLHAAALERPRAGVATSGATSGAGAGAGASADAGTKTVKRVVGDQSWEDATLLEWDPKHFRLFVGNLGPDANDALLTGAFGKYASLRKVKVPVDKRTGANKGYGFVAFESADDYFRAFKEMNGKYVGQHPVQLKRAETAIKPVKRRK